MLKAFFSSVKFPFWFFHLPILPYYLYLSCKARSLTFFANANPSMHMGGFMNTPKSDYYKKLDPALVPKFIFISPPVLTADILELMKRKKIDFPVILKPNAGERGKGVVKINDPVALALKLNRLRYDCILQEYIDYPLEFGVLYYRFPDENKKGISSIALKELPYVVGDGISSIKILLKEKKGNFRIGHIPSETIPAKGEPVFLDYVAHRNKGTIFKNYNHINRPELVDVFDRISKQLEGFYLGRFDIKVPSTEDLMAGKNIKILEVNGVNSQPIHIFDPNISFIKKYRDLARHWKLIYQISRQNTKKGLSPPSFATLRRELIEYKKHQLGIMEKSDQKSIHKVLIIGAGVSGLTTAYCLQKANYKTVVVAEYFSPNVTSNVAGALWEWPPAVCGYHQNQVSLKRSKEWCMESYAQFFELAKDKSTGVNIKPVIFFFRENVNENNFHLMKMNELKNKVKEFRHDKKIIEEEGINPNIGLVDAYCHLAPMINTDIYMEWLMKEVKKMGSEIIERKISGKIKDQEQELLTQYKCDFIINCSGLGAMELADEYMYPLRGALIRIKNDGKYFPVLNKAYCVSFDEKTKKQDIVFIVPRGENHVILGALGEKDEWDKSINLENYKPIKEMLSRCQEFLPYLKNAQLDEQEPVRVGLRPFREENVRLELDENTRIIHNYGHGGAGVTFSWGCAHEIVTLVNRMSNLC